MPQVCTICKHAMREDIDCALLKGDSFRNIAQRFGTSPTALFRHKKRDLPAALVKAKDASEAVRAETLLDRLKALNVETLAILREARDSGKRDNELALKAITRVERQLEFEARLLGEFDDSAKVAVGVSVNPREPEADSSPREELKMRLDNIAARMRQAPECPFCGTPRPPGAVYASNLSRAESLSLLSFKGSVT